MVSAQFFVTLFYKTPGSFEALFTRCPPDMTSLLNSFITVTARSVLFTYCKARMEFSHALLRKDLWSLYLHVQDHVQSLFHRVGMACTVFFVSLSLILVPHRGNKPNPTGHEGYV